MPKITDDILVHIGYHKTGTTWLQQELFIHGNAVFEPVSRHDKGQSTLARMLIYDGLGYLQSPFSFDSQSVIAEYNALAQSGDRDFHQKTPVISHERLVGNPNTGGFDAAAIAERMAAVFSNARILIVIREQQSMYFSDYYNYLFLGGSLSLKKYLFKKYDGKVPGFSPAHFDYLPLIRKYMDLFGKENVLVLPYEMFVKAPDRFFEQIGKLTGRKIEFEKEKLAVRRNLKTNKYANYRLRWGSFFIMQNSMNAQSPFFSRAGSMIFRGLKMVFGYLVPASAEKRLVAAQKKLIAGYIGDRYAGSNEEISALTGIDLSEFGYHGNMTQQP